MKEVQFRLNHVRAKRVQGVHTHLVQSQYTHGHCIYGVLVPAKNTLLHLLRPYAAVGSCGDWGMLSAACEFFAICVSRRCRYCLI